MPNELISDVNDVGTDDAGCDDTGEELLIRVLYSMWSGKHLSSV